MQIWPFKWPMLPKKIMFRCRKDSNGAEMTIGLTLAEFGRHFSLFISFLQRIASESPRPPMGERWIVWTPNFGEIYWPKRSRKTSRFKLLSDHNSHGEIMIFLLPHLALFLLLCMALGHISGHIPRSYFIISAGIWPWRNHFLRLHNGST